MILNRPRLEAVVDQDVTPMQTHADTCMYLDQPRLEAVVDQDIITEELERIGLRRDGVVYLGEGRGAKGEG